MGRQTSAPVFREVAQQVLEYLGVPHDQPLKTTKEMAGSQRRRMPEDAPSENTRRPERDVRRDEHLPADDPSARCSPDPAQAAVTCERRGRRSAPARAAPGAAARSAMSELCCRRRCWRRSGRTAVRTRACQQTVATAGDSAARAGGGAATSAAAKRGGRGGCGTAGGRAVVYRRGAAGCGGDGGRAGPAGGAGGQRNGARAGSGGGDDGAVGTRSRRAVRRADAA